MVIIIGMMKMNCYKCKTKQDLNYNKVPFRATCSICDSDLHVCRNCKHYIVGKPNDCNVPNTEYVSDRESSNFCEDFSPSESIKEDKTKSSNDLAKKLFKDNDDIPIKRDFDSLFND